MTFEHSYQNQPRGDTQHFHQGLELLKRFSDKKKEGVTDFSFSFSLDGSLATISLSLESEQAVVVGWIFLETEVANFIFNRHNFPSDIYKLDVTPVILNDLDLKWYLRVMIQLPKYLSVCFN